MIGQIRIVMGSAKETIFALQVSEGKQHTFLATAKDTQGFGAVAIDHFAKIRAIKYSHSPNVFIDNLSTEAPEFLALEYKMVKRPKSQTVKTPWWRFW